MKEEDKIAQEMEILEKALQKQEPNFEKQIAQAILDAQKMREESYVATSPPEAFCLGEYKLEIEECLIATCKQQGLSVNFWYLLSLVVQPSWNDIQLWAEDVLAGKNILEECEKENAKMKDGIKRIHEELIEDGVLNEKGEVK